MNEVHLISRAEALQQPLLRAQVAGLQRAFLDEEDDSAAKVAARGFEPELLTTPDIPLRTLTLYHPTANLQALAGQLSAALRLVLRAVGAAS